jgi:hypothetical protein
MHTSIPIKNQIADGNASIVPENDKYALSGLFSKIE